MDDNLDDKKVQQGLISALGIRYYVHNFQALAADLNLLSLNAQIASAKLGDSGNAFKVVTAENTGISNLLTGLAKRIRELTHEWTKINAKSTQESRNMGMFIKARGKLGKDAQDLKTKMIAVENSYKESITKAQTQERKIIVQLANVIEEMENSLRLINYVRSVILVETSHLENDSVSRASFQHLAEQMDSAALRVREVATLALSQLKQITL